MLTKHEITDWEKYEQIKESLKIHGWVGAPLVLADDNGNLITGTHRYYAATAVGYQDCEIPTVLLEDIFTEAGLDLDTIASEWEYPTLFEPIFEQMINAELPQGILNKYGIQLG